MSLLNGPHKKNAPDAAPTATEGESIPTEKEENDMTTVTPTTDAPLVPIYGPSDPRWSVLLEWLEANHHNAGTIADLSPYERAAWFEAHINGADFAEIARRDVVYPEIPAQTQPVWAEGFDEAGYDVHDRPTRLWFGDLATAENVDCTVNLTRDDVFDPETKTIIEGDVAASLWLDGDMHESRIPDPSVLREIARTLYDAATKWETLLAPATRTNATEVL